MTSLDLDGFMHGFIFPDADVDKRGRTSCADRCAEAPAPTRAVLCWLPQDLQADPQGTSFPIAK